ncbi:MAG TPA: response regulator, partial [Thermoanaerobaculia bacterium]
MSGRSLIVEDDVMFVEIFQRILRRFACDGPVAGNVAEAIAALQKHDYDVVLLDLRLQDSDGENVLDYIRRSKPHLIANVIAVSSSPVMARTLA